MVTERNQCGAGLNGAGGLLKVTVQCPLSGLNQRPRSTLIYLLQCGKVKAIQKLS